MDVTLPQIHRPRAPWDALYLPCTLRRLLSDCAIEALTDVSNRVVDRQGVRPGGTANLN